MAVFKATQNKSDSAGKFKATKNRSYDSTLVYDWENRNKESYDALEKYRQRINSGGYLSADDLTAYRKALDSYVETSTSLRGFSKAMGQGKDDDDAWTKTIADMESGYKGISDYFSQWKTEDAFKKSVEAQKDREQKLSLDTNAYRGELEALEKQRDELIKELDANDSSIGTANVDRGAMDLVSQIDDLEKKIQEKKLYLSEADRLQEGVRLASVSGSEDFDAFDDYVSTEYGEGFSWDKLFKNDYGLGYEDLTYEYINNQNGIRAEIDRKHSIYSKGSGDGESRFKANGYDLMQENEIAIYNYYYAKEGKEAAEKYLNSIQETLNSRKAAGMYENLEDNFLLEMAFGVVAGVDQFKSGMGGLADAVTGNDDYKAPSATQMASGMVREDLADVDLKWYNFKDKAWGDANIFGNSLGQAAYDSVTTTSNMLPSILASTAVNLVAPGAGSIVGTGILGASAGGNAYREMINLGYDKGQARAYAAMVGGSEALLQYALGGISSLGGGTEGIFQTVAGKLLPHVDKAFARTAIKLGANMLDEGLEEGLQEILTPWFQNLVLNADAKVDWSEVAYSSLLGALTAGIMEGGGTVSGEVNTYTQGRKLLKSDFSAERLAEIGKTFSADTVAYQLAGKVNENTSAYTIGRLFNEIGATMTEQNVNDITNALVAKGWDEATARKNAEAIAYVIEGGHLTDSQIAFIEANEGLAEAARATLFEANTTWNQRANGYNDAVMALAQEQSGVKSSRTNPAQQSEENAPTADTVDAISESGVESASEADTGPAKFKSIASIKNKRATLAMEDGTEADARDVDLDPDDGVRIETIASIDGITSTDANFILKTLRENTGASAQMDALGAKDAYKYGFYGFSKDMMTKHAVFANSLSQAQRDAIYEAGQKARQSQIEKAAPKTTAKQRGVYFDYGGGNVVAFKDADKSSLTEDKRKAGVQVAMILNKLGIGGSIYFFESYRNAKGQLVYKDSSGKEVKAPNGWYSEKDGSIHIDLNSGRAGNGLVLYTLSHELTHFIEQWSPKKYKVLADFLIENYEKGQSVDALVRNKQAKLSANRGEKVSYDEAYSEVVADSMEAMLADGNVLEKLIELKAKDQGLFMKMKQFFDNLLTKIRNAYKGLTPDSAEGNAVLEMTDAIERIQQLFAEALVDASENFQSAMESVVETNAEAVAENEILTDGAVVTDGNGKKYSIKSMKHDIAEGQMFEDLKKYCGWSQKQVNDLRKNLTALVEYMTPFRDILDMNEAYDREGRRFSPYKPNSDPLYKISMDFSTLCSKRLLTQYVIEKLQLRENRPMSAEEQMAIRDMLIEYRKVEKGLQVACAMCYVEAARLKSPKQIQKWLADPATQMKNYFADKDPEFSAYIKEKQSDFKESRGYARNATKKDMKAKDITELNKIRPRLRSQYQVSAEEQKVIDRAVSLPNSTFLTAGNLASLSESDPVIYSAYTAFVRTATRSKSLETDEPYYYGDSTRDNGNGIVVTDSFIEEVNRENGMRFSSWSDWRIQHLLDYITAVIDNSVRGAAMHGYTKFGEEVRVLGKTGMMFNMSGVPGSQTGLNEDGSLNFSPTESMDVDEAIQLREEFPEHAGLQCIGVSDAHIIALLRSDIIDYVIPYHTSGLNAVLRRMVNIFGWDDYTGTQHAAIDKSIKYDDAVDKEHWHEEPVYSEFFVGYDTGMTGIEAMRESAKRYAQMCRDRGLTPKFEKFLKEENYWKLLIDRKMINQKTGNLIRQKAVTPTFDFDTIKEVVDRHVKNYDSNLEARALDHIVENWDSIPQRIKDLKKQGTAKAKKTKKAVDTLANQTLAAQGIDTSAVQSSIREGMTDQERYEALKGKQITVITDGKSAEYASDIASLEALKTRAKSKAEKIIKPLATKLGILGKTLSAADVEIEFIFSANKGLPESMHKQLRYGGSYVDFAKALINLDHVLETAVLVEVHGDKYAGTVRANENLEAVYVLFGAFRDGKHIIPVQMEIKKSSDIGGRLYMTVAMTKIEADVVGSTPGKNRTHSLVPASEYSLADIFREINTTDAHFLKYLPDGFLSEEQITAKEGAIAEDTARIDGYERRNSDRAEAVELSDAHTQYSLREEAPPKRTIKAYKVFRVADGKLYPPKIANLTDDESLNVPLSRDPRKGKSRVTATGNDTPVGVWINADVGGIAVDENGEAILNTNGRIKVYDLNGMKGDGRFDEKTTLAFRPGWHLGSIPEAIQFLLGDGTMPDDLVYAECEIAADIDYQAAAMSYGVRPSGKFVHADAGLPAVPVDGYYKYKTNPKTDTHPWFISGAIKVNRIIGDAERRAICAKEGITIAPRYSGVDIEPTDIWENGQPEVAKDLTPYKKSQKNYDNEQLLAKTLEKIKALSAGNPKLGYIQRELDFNSQGILDEIEKAKLDVDALRSSYEKHGFNPYYFDTDEEVGDSVQYSDRDFLAEDQLKGNYTVSEITEMFDAWNSDTELSELSKKVFAKLQEIQDSRSRPSSIIGFYTKPYPISFKSNAYIQKEFYHTPNGVFIERLNDRNYGITYNLEYFKSASDQEKAHVLLHEAIHACTVSAIQVAERRIPKHADPLLFNSLDDWSEEQKAGLTLIQTFLQVRTANERNEYGQKDVYEMVAEMANPEFRAMLKKERLWNRIVDAIKRIFGIEQRTAYDAVSNALEKILEVDGAHYSERETESVSNRSLLANAFEGVAKNDLEKQKIQEYRNQISLINAEEQKLSELNQKIKDLSFAKGPKDTKAIRDMQFEARQTANRINTMDKILLRLEASKPLQDVLTREKEMVRKREQQKSKEALEAYREKATNTQRELLKKWQDSRKKGIDSRQRTAMRHKIKDIVNELNQYLLKGTKDRHVPIGLQKAVAEALNAVNMDSVGADERIAKLNDELLKAKTPEEIQEISKRIEHIREMGDRMDEKLKKLKTAYDEFLDSDDPLIANSHDDAVAAHMMRLIVQVGDTPLRDMNMDQLQAVYDVYKIVLATIRNANKSFKDNKNREISTRANQVMAEIDNLGVKRGKRPVFMDWVEKFGWDGLKPVYAMEHIGSKGLIDAYNNVRAGEDVWAKDIVEAREYYLEKFRKYKHDSWDFDKKLKFTSTTGKNFELTLDQIMSLYAYSKRDQAADHLKYGGIVFDPKTEVVEKTKSGIKVKYNLADATAYNISEETLADIISTLTDEQKGFVDEMQTYLSDVMGAKGNEVSLAMYDVKLFKEKHYFPLKSAHQYMAKAKEQAQGDVKIKNSGFSKETKPHAKNPIVLSSFMDVWTSHVNEMSMYHAFVLPMEDFYRIYNYTTPSKNENLPTEGVNAYIENAYGAGATGYIEQMLKDLNGGARADSRTGFINKMMGLYKKGAVFASLSVVVQQPSAIARAAALVDTKYFIGPKVDSLRHKALWAEVKQYAPVAIIKEMGYFDTNMGKSTHDYITGQEYSGFKAKMKALVTDSNYRDEILSKAPALADEIAWCSIWEAVKRETKAKYPGLDVNGEPFLMLAGSRFTEVITKTQVYDSVLSRSAMMRSKDTGMKMATAFMAEPTTSINMISDALLQGKRGNTKYCRATIGAVIASQIINSILVSFVYAGRDDDEDETYAEKYIGTLTGEILDSLNPATYIPFIKDIVSIVQGYDVERSDMSVVSDLWNAWQKLGSNNLSVYRKVEGFAGSIAQIFGLPVKNIMRDVRGIYQTIMSFVNGPQTTAAGIGYAVKSAIPEWIGGGDTSNQNQLYEAYLSGDETQIARVESRYKDQSSINSAIRKALRENDPRILKAAQAVMNGNGIERANIAREIAAEGHFDLQDIQAAINAEIDKLRKEAKGN